ncbi:MAG: hypothetical protein QM809_03145 [Gordonia sp. (in: high G+C Gram-positive bacteria)]|uniref:hypothetical protein n=1 Tax=Gordonia sp. (in: high G+C Gram-positive bacteria) TaxID=84139 RepID=UPI0039E6EF34
MRITKTAVTTLFACAVALTAVACGEENQAADTPSQTSASTPAPPADRSVPVVGGPSRKAESTTSAKLENDKHCGVAKGPDGSLQVRLVSGDVTCKTAMEISKDYSPLIATGKSQTVSGWDCGPSTESGELARCTKDDSVFAFTAS